MFNNNPLDWRSAFNELQPIAPVYQQVPQNSLPEPDPSIIAMQEYKQPFQNQPIDSFKPFQAPEKLIQSAWPHDDQNRPLKRNKVTGLPTDVVMNPRDLIVANGQKREFLENEAEKDRLTAADLHYLNSPNPTKYKPHWVKQLPELVEKHIFKNSVAKALKVDVKSFDNYLEIYPEFREQWEKCQSIPLEIIESQLADHLKSGNLKAGELWTYAEKIAKEKYGKDATQEQVKIEAQHLHAKIYHNPNEMSPKQHKTYDVNPANVFKL